MPIPHPTDHAKWRTKSHDPELAMREAVAFQKEAAEPEAWTVALLSRRVCRLFGKCPGCGLQKPVDVDALVAAGHGGLKVSTLKLRCSECGAQGEPLLTWIGTARQRCERNFATGETKGGWRGAYPFKAAKEDVDAALAALRENALTGGPNG